jgi:hypothetical protein
MKCERPVGVRQKPRISEASVSAQANFGELNRTPPLSAGADKNGHPRPDIATPRGRIEAVSSRRGLSPTRNARPGHPRLISNKTPDGDIVIKGKGGVGPGEPTGININKL